MTKTEMTKLVRSMGANENTITAMENAYEMGVDFEREACAQLVYYSPPSDEYENPLKAVYEAIRARGEA